MKRCFTLEPSVDNLDTLFDALRPFCEREGCTKKMFFEMMLICEELFVNICNYGFTKDMERIPVEFEVTADDKLQMLQLIITDEGIAYDPLAFESERVHAHHAIGGLGILLVRNYVDGITYDRVNDKNILCFEKRYV